MITLVFSPKYPLPSNLHTTVVPPASTNRLCKSKRSPLDSDSGYYNHSDYNIVDADHQLKQVPIHLTMQVAKQVQVVSSWCKRQILSRNSSVFTKKSMLETIRMTLNTTFHSLTQNETIDIDLLRFFGSYFPIRRTICDIILFEGAYYLHNAPTF